MSADLALYRLVLQRGPQPFAWGTRDCVMWAGDAVHAVTGRDPVADLRGTYSSWPEAAALLRRLGGLRGLCDARFGAQVATAEARDGDVALLDRRLCTGEGGGTGALGVVWRGMVSAQGDNCIIGLRLDAIALLWRPA